MRVLATFDGSAFSESIMPQLQMMAQLPSAEFTLLGIAWPGGGVARGVEGARPQAITGMVEASAAPIVAQADEPQWAEDHGQAIERHRAEFRDYLEGLREALPAAVSVRTEVVVSDKPQTAIVDAARRMGVDVIVMATHSRRGIAHALFGSTTEHVVRSGVAPVLVVHPRD